MRRENFLKALLIICLTSFSTQISSQVISDNFEDGDLIGWTEGTASDWTNSTSSPITDTRSLKHNLSGVSSNSYIYHDITSLDLTTQDVTWSFNLANGSWDPSGANKFWVYLTANDTNLNGTTVDGYAVGVNLTGSTDILTLWKVTDGAADGAIVTSTFDWNSSNIVGIRVIRTSTGTWELLIDTDGGFDSLVSAGTALNTDYTHDNNFGLSFTFTSSRAGLLKMDDVTVVGNPAAPTIGFNSATSSETETNATFTSANIPITVSNYDGNQIDININVTGGTAEAGDFSFTSPTALSFIANATQNITFDINDDADFDNETVIFTITETSAVTGLIISQATHTVTITDDETPPLPNIIINEILADDGVIDANQDGSTAGTDDEFVELVNLDPIPYDLTGYTIADAVGIKYTFGAVTIPAGGSVVIFSGGTTPFTNIPGISDKASGGLGFNNTGDTVTLENAASTVIDTYTYANEANDDQSIGRNEDLTGSFVKHEAILTNPVLASPGRYNVSNVPFTTLTWWGRIDNDWDTASNWSFNTVPTSGDDIHILKTANEPTVSSAVTVSSVTIDTGASLIAQSTFSGVVTYNLFIPDTNWHLVSSPVTGEQYNDAWVIANAINTNGTGNNVGISTYDNGTPHATTLHWRYFQGGTTEDFTAGIGYSNLRTAAGNYSFTGTFPTEAVSPAISTDDTHDNLLGNPYPSYLNVAAFITANTNNLTITHQAVYVWDGAAYTNLTTGYIHPGQAFFISSNVASGTATITEAMQSHNTGSFYRSNTPTINLTLSNGTSTRKTQINYINGKTKALDPRFDVGMFVGVSSSLNIFTYLIEGNEGVAFETQALPNVDLETMVVPVGIKAVSGKEIIFSAETLNLPAGIKVFLEDRIANTFTRLDEANSNYKLTLTNDMNGIGRFYLHTTESILSIKDLVLNSVSIFKTDISTLKLTGLPQGKTTLSLYSILGKKVFTSTFKTNGVKNTSLPKLETGVYIAKVQTENGKISRKIILD